MQKGRWNKMQYDVDVDEPKTVKSIELTNKKQVNQEEKANQTYVQTTIKNMETVSKQIQNKKKYYSLKAGK